MNAEKAEKWDFAIRKAVATDISAVTAVYNEAIELTNATFDTEPKALEYMEDWFSGHGPGNPVLVAELDGKVVGWAALSEYSAKCAYTETAELSLYVLREHRAQGIGGLLLKSILEAGKEARIHAIISRITAGNEASVRLHERAGFKMVGTMREVGRKFGELLDVHIMELINDV